MIAQRNIFSGACLLLLILSQVALRAADAVNVTIEADATTLAVGESTVVTVYGQIDAAIEGDSDQIFSWYLDVLNDNGGVVGDYADVQTTSSDNTPATSGDGTLEGANLRGIHDTFLKHPGAGKGSRVVLVRFEVTALVAGSATFSVDVGSTVGALSDFLVAQSGGGSFAGGNYAGASVEITVTGEVDLSDLDLKVTSTGNQADLTFNPIPGYNHTAQFSDSLLPLSWVDLPGSPHNAGIASEFVTGVPRRFYRVNVTEP